MPAAAAAKTGGCPAGRLGLFLTGDVVRTSAAAGAAGGEKGDDDKSLDGDRARDKGRRDETEDGRASVHVPSSDSVARTGVPTRNLLSRRLPCCCCCCCCCCWSRARAAERVCWMLLCALSITGGYIRAGLHIGKVLLRDR